MSFVINKLVDLRKTETFSASAEVFLLISLEFVAHIRLALRIFSALSANEQISYRRSRKLYYEAD